MCPQKLFEVAGNDGGGIMGRGEALYPGPVSLEYSRCLNCKVLTFKGLALPICERAHSVCLPACLLALQGGEDETTKLFIRMSQIGLWERCSFGFVTKDMYLGLFVNLSKKPPFPYLLLQTAVWNRLESIIVSLYGWENGEHQEISMGFAQDISDKQITERKGVLGQCLLSGSLGPQEQTLSFCLIFCEPGSSPCQAWGRSWTLTVGWRAQAPKSDCVEGANSACLSQDQLPKEWERKSEWINMTARALLTRPRSSHLHGDL